MVKLEPAVHVRNRIAVGAGTLARDLVIAVAAVCATLVLCELGMRAAGDLFKSSFFRTEWKRGYVFRPNAKGWWIGEDRIYTEINPEGQHDTQHVVANFPGTRIAVIGSSYVSGMQVPLKDNFTVVLQKILSGDKRLKQPIDVLNFGCDGYSAGQAYQTLPDVWRYGPQLVIYLVTEMDLLNATRETAWDTWGGRPFFELTHDGKVVPDELSRQRPRPTAADIATEDRRNQLLNHSELALAAESAYFKLTGRFSKKVGRPNPYTANPDYMYRLPLLPPPKNGPMETDWRIFQALVPEWKRQVDAHGAELWIIPAGFPQQENPDPAFRKAFLKSMGSGDLYYWNQRVESIALANGAKTFELPQMMAEYATAHKVYLHGFFYTPVGMGHWNVKGNAAAAEFVAQALTKFSRYFAPSSH